jgi:hypothetical protein
MIIFNSTILIKNISLSTLNNTKKEEIQKIVEKKIIELKTNPIKKDFVDTIQVLNDKFICEYTIQKNKITTIIKNKKNIKIYTLTNSI